MSFWTKKIGHGNKCSETCSDFAVHGMGFIVLVQAR